MIVPHPTHVIIELERRHAELLAESARQRRARLAEQASDPLTRRRADGLPTAAALVLLALLAAVAASAMG